MAKMVTKEELIKRYMVYITLSSEEKNKMRSKIVQDTGRNIDIMRCMEAVRQGYADFIRII